MREEREIVWKVSYRARRKEDQRAQDFAKAKPGYSDRHSFLPKTMSKAASLRSQVVVSSAYTPRKSTYSNCTPIY